MNLVLRKGAFSSVLAQGPLGPVSEVHGVFDNTNLTFHLWGQPKAIAMTYDAWGNLLGNPDQHVKRGLLLTGVGASVRWSLALGDRKMF